MIYLKADDGLAVLRGDEGDGPRAARPGSRKSRSSPSARCRGRAMTHTNDPQAQHHKEMQRKRRLGEHEDAHASSGAMSDINITPLIDVMLVLLIIFMVVTPLAQKGLDISLPQPPPPNQPEQKTPSNQVVLALEEDAITVNKNPVIDRGARVAAPRHLPGALGQDDLRPGHRRRPLRPRRPGDGHRQGRGRRADRDHLRQDDRGGGRRRRRPALGLRAATKPEKGPLAGPFPFVPSPAR